MMEITDIVSIDQYELVFDVMIDWPILSYDCMSRSD